MLIVETFVSRLIYLTFSRYSLDCTLKQDKFDDLLIPTTERDMSHAYTSFKNAERYFEAGKSTRAYRLVDKLDAPSKNIVMVGGTQLC